MSEDTQDRRQQILDAALKVFSEQGFHKASIKQIARTAQIKSSALIYWYFEDKRALLQAVITERSPLSQSPALQPELREAIFAQPPEMVLKQIAHNILSLQDDTAAVNMMRLYIGEATRDPDVAEALADFQLTMIGFLTDYLHHQIAQGILRHHDTRATSRAFIGMLIINILGNQVFKPAAVDFPPREDYVQEIVNLFLKGISQ